MWEVCRTDYWVCQDGAHVSGVLGGGRAGILLSNYIGVRIHTAGNINVLGNDFSIKLWREFGASSGVPVIIDPVGNPTAHPASSTDDVLGHFEKSL